MRTITIHTDGASRGNPGPAAIAYVITDQGKQYTDFKTIGNSTNNVAEYSALLFALKRLTALYPTSQVSLQIYTDSQLMARQIQGIYKIKDPTLKDIYFEIMQIISAYKYTINDIPRRENSQADSLCNQALDQDSQKVL
jgi:ribonuclease HI